MRKFTLSLITVLFTTFAAGSQNLNTLTKKEKDEGWILLFNGINLDGWKKYNGAEVTGWSVKDGVLRNSGVGSDHGGDIITKRQDFKDFELYLEWKINPKSNSGIFYHAKDGVADRIYKSGIEYQLIDGEGWPGKLHEYQYSGALYGMYPPAIHAVKPVGEWNVTRIIVKGNHIEHWLNGKKVVDCEMNSADWKERRAKSKWKGVDTWAASEDGGIGLQDHGGLTQFRNIKIREL
ncbi:MAG: DUF1080 domain-containing protein [Chlorobi bacterium]|nr:DUF1080 domain-containing protein [Chlorobiota bacterium]